MSETTTLPPIKVRALGEARDEIERELQVRERIYPRWLSDGRLTRSDAIDRHHRLATALLVLKAACERHGETAVPSTGDMTEPKS